MRDNYILTAESVTEGHPDKLCDYIADSVLDACLEKDSNARVACEVMATKGKIIAAGEITAKELPDIPHIICRSVREVGYCGDYEVEIILHDQSLEISGAVEEGNELGAGDQGIIYGYACDETAVLLPLPVVLAHEITMSLTDARKHGLLPGLLPDGKAQVSVEYRGEDHPRVAAVVVSCQHEQDYDIIQLQGDIYEYILLPIMEDLMDEETTIWINPGGSFVLGGFEADTGLTGRKLMVDTYWGIVPHGGGALSGKDGTKVDRSAAYMARYIAKNIVAAGLARECTVGLAYAIGVAEPVAVTVDTYGTGTVDNDVLVKAIRMIFTLTPTEMISILGLDRPIFAQFCNYGHFTHKDAPWEQLDCKQLFVDAVEMVMEGHE